MKNWKIIFRALLKFLFEPFTDKRGEASLPDFGKFYRDENGVLYFENSNKIFKITSTYIEKLKDETPTLKQRITKLINSELLR